MNTTFYAGMLGGPEIIAILIVVLIVFGGKKIPELMKGLGKGVKEYKNAVNSIEDEVKDLTKQEENKVSTMTKGEENISKDE